MRNPNTKNRLLTRLVCMAIAFVCLAAFLVFAQRSYYSLERFMALEEPAASTSPAAYSEATEETTAEAAEPAAPMVEFSLDNAFVSPGDTLELTLPAHLADHTEIVYTMDGSDPTENGMAYTGPIVFEELEDRGCWLVRARVVQGDTISELYERTYIPAGTAVLGENIYAVLLYGDEDDLFSNDRGILALGAEDEQTANADESIPESQWTDERANYFGEGLEWEREVRVEILDDSGERILLQDAGLRIAGASSRLLEQKSLRLYARSRYDDEERGKFHVADIWPGVTSAEGSATPITKYNHLDLRNGGSDFAATMLSDATMRMLAEDAGYGPMYTPVPAVVYLNGEYYGFAWLQTDYHEKNLADMFQLENVENIQIIGNAEHFSYSADFPELKDEYLTLYDFALGDMNRQRNADRLEEMVDMDNYLLYCALQLYANNNDWPHNNYKLWRYVGATNEEKANNPYADGRWRFILYDLDFSYDTHNEGIEGFEWAITHQQSPLLASVLQNEGFRQRFVNIYCRLLATALSEGHAAGVIYSVVDTIEPELVYREATDPDQKIFDQNFRQVMYLKLDDFLERRPREIYARITEYFGYESMYTLDVQSPETGATIWLDGYAYKGGDGISAPFYNACEVTLTCELAEGWLFDGWEVNGELVKTAKLTLGGFAEGEDMGTQTVRARISRKAQGEAVIGSISYRNAWNWISFTNVGETEYNLHRAYLTQENEIIYVFPDVVLQPGESYTILEQSNELSEADRGEYIADFRFHKGDEINLYASNGKLLDSAALPAKNVGYVYHHSPNSGAWMWTPIDEYEQ